MTRLILLIILLAGTAVASGCDAAAPVVVGQQVVVAGFLEAGEALAEVRVTRTVGLGEVYDSTAVLADARVRVDLLAASGAVERSVAYRFDGPTGAFVPVGTLPGTLPGRTYRLTAEALGDTVTAETTVPALVTLVEPPPDEVVYQYNAVGPPLRITTSSTASRQAVYVASVTSLAADRFDAVTVDGETRYRSANLPGTFRPVRISLLFNRCDVEGAGLLCRNKPDAAGTSPIINEASYTRLGDGTARLDVPWLAFGFYGPAEIAIVSLDAAFQSFVEGQAVQDTGGGTLSPGEIPNITTNVRGGLGVFGSFARAVARTTVRERPYDAPSVPGLDAGLAARFEGRHGRGREARVDGLDRH